ncbi:transcription factor PHYTOCHROME INTERACTING FACTOR-LIKE 15-like, partial [Curcuma longa]|uniref:transcription factor PHYTOCHROME INTERACTING FACTOR-LIKE 15-like n=1 Tax=Curcuma longa TaxID=136217 RepID=UPI003D9E1352
ILWLRWNVCLHETFKVVSCYHELTPRTVRQKQEIIKSRMTNGSSDLFAISDHDFAELFWEDGQIVIQSQSTRTPKSSFPSSPFFHYGTVEEKDTREIDPKFPRSPYDGFDDCTPRNDANKGVKHQEDDTVPWISYPVEKDVSSETLQPQNDYCAELLNEFSAFDPDPPSSDKCTVAATGKTVRLCPEVRRSNNMEFGHAAKAPRWNWESGRIRTHHPHQYKVSALNTNSTVVEGVEMAQEQHCRNARDRRLQNQGITSSKQLQRPSIYSLTNFPHFARPDALAEVRLQNPAGWKGIEKASTPPSSNRVNLTSVENSSGTKDANKVSGQSSSDPQKLKLGSALKDLQGGGSVEFYNNICAEDALGKNAVNFTNMPDNLPSSNFAARVVLCRNDIRKAPEAASSSVCSVNVTGAALNEQKYGKKINDDGEELDYPSHSKELQEESVVMRKPSTGRSAQTKRSRVAEVHNLSERRRRNRINEKMLALQELIPNCNKVDKASMLEEAIEYLKTLQMQVQKIYGIKQIMSMGSRLYMPPMMLTPAMQHMHATMRPNFPSADLEMSRSTELALGCPMLEIPPMHAPQFPCAPSSGQSSMNRTLGHVNPSTFGIQGQGIPVLMPRSPQFSTLTRRSMNTDSVPEVHAQTVIADTGDQHEQQK